ncbi:MAG: C40 family peptidase [Sphingobacteriaceae bacterium]|nr:C40 family peptidase [Sphingobacteriaceae bacterium]
MKLFKHIAIFSFAIALVFSSCKSKKDLSKKTVSTPSVSWKESLNLSSRDVKHSKLYSFIDEWYGVPYKYGGCKKSGVDCSCFTDNLYAEVYGNKLGRTAGEIHKSCEKISKHKLEEGDLVFFIINGRSISHVGVYLKDNKFVHASTKRGVIVSDLDEAYYKKYFYSAGRYKKESS